MKRPSVKREKKVKAPAPHELVAASPFARLPEKEPRFKRKPKDEAPKPKKPKKSKKSEKPKKARAAKKVKTPQEQAAAAAAAAATPVRKQPKGRVGRILGAPLALVRKPLAKLGGLRGWARVVVWGLVAIIVVVAGLQLRGGRDDDKLVRTALERYEAASSRKDYQALCDELLAKSYVKQTASSGLPCEVALRTALEDVRNPTLEVLSVEVNGDRAAARVRGSAAGQVPGEAVYTLVREDDAWRILPPRPASTPAAP